MYLIRSPERSHDGSMWRDQVCVQWHWEGDGDQVDWGSARLWRRGQSSTCWAERPGLRHCPGCYSTERLRSLGALLSTPAASLTCPITAPVVSLMGDSEFCQLSHVLRVRWSQRSRRCCVVETWQELHVKFYIYWMLLFLLFPYPAWSGRAWTCLSSSWKNLA